MAGTALERVFLPTVTLSLVHYERPPAYSLGVSSSDQGDEVLGFWLSSKPNIILISFLQDLFTFINVLGTCCVIQRKAGGFQCLKSEM